jgi:hypothetical protein
MIPIPSPKSTTTSILIDKTNAGVPPMLIKGFLGGLSGSGKTQSAITLPKSVEKPLLLIDLDNRWETVRDEVEAGLVKVHTIFDPNPLSPTAWDQLEKLRNELWAMAQKGEFPYSGVIEDGLSMLSAYAINSSRQRWQGFYRYRWNS